MAVISYWVYLGLFYLILLTYKDFKNNMWVDDRLNYIMIGLSISLYSHIRPVWWYVLTIIAVTIGLNIYLRWKKPLGEADISTITWLFLGFAIIDLGYLVIFIMILLVLMFTYSFIKGAMKMGRKATPFYIVILLAYIFTCAFLRLFAL